MNHTRQSLRKATGARRGQRNGLRAWTLWLTDNPNEDLSGIGRAMKWAVRTGRLSALAERLMDEMTSFAFVDLLLEILESENVHILAHGMKAIQAAMTPRVRAAK